MVVEIESSETQHKDWHHFQGTTNPSREPQRSASKSHGLESTEVLTKVRNETFSARSITGFSWFDS
ncbi:MAG: hypothetical protein JWO91_2848, partial [Acidobacteriaceae bacterium]|nr:hypothetical protein [Acidobacteriaceae bacterium]